MTLNHDFLAKELVRIRICQLLVNEAIREKKFRIPIHLAMGHEAIAIALAQTHRPGDQLLLSHRNIHYHLAFGATLRSLVDEYSLLPSGLAGGQLGSMNLSSPGDGLIYTSSVLGNNLPVAAGVALAAQIRDTDTLTTVVTGDGAMEEGSFYETILMSRSQNTRCLVVIENNGWSLATEIAERRCHIDLSAIAKSLDIPFVQLDGNSIPEYIRDLSAVRADMMDRSCPAIVEVKLKSLGDWTMTTPERPEGKYINYHAGLAPHAILSDWPVLRNDLWDPMYVVSQGANIDELKAWAATQALALKAEMS